MTPRWIVMNHLGRKLFCQMRSAPWRWKCPALTFPMQPVSALSPIVANILPALSPLPLLFSSVSGMGVGGGEYFKKEL